MHIFMLPPAKRANIYINQKYICIMYLYKLELYTHVGQHAGYINYDAQYSGELIFQRMKKNPRSQQFYMIIFDDNE